ncbi:hypothetical protein ACOACQ_19230 [Nocardioides sp. CPCC 206347]|uniref:hypothetical protein n=1 Tax=unclassified Nocardioides TaxID=2615069 RepID=UPI003606D7AE
MTEPIEALRGLERASVRRAALRWVVTKTHSPDVHDFEIKVPHVDRNKSRENRWAIVHESPDAQQVYMELAPSFEDRERRRDPLSRSVQEVRNLFKVHADEWRDETQFVSNLSKIVAHPAYQKIIGLGPQAVPLIIAELRVQPELWFWALTSIVGEDQAQGVQTVSEAASSWVAWYDRLVADSDW